jgi:hypothetical protein
MAKSAQPARMAGFAPESDKDVQLSPGLPWDARRAAPWLKVGLQAVSSTAFRRNAAG